MLPLMNPESLSSYFAAGSAGLVVAPADCSWFETSGGEDGISPGGAGVLVALSAGRWLRVSSGEDAMA